MEDLSILKAFRQKDIAGCRMAFQKYYKPLCMYAFAYLKDRAKAEDAVQDSFVALCSKADLWPNIIDVRSYLYKTVGNRCKSIINSQQSATKYETAFIATYSDEVSEPDLIPENTSDLFDRVKDAISLLAPKRRKVVSLVYLEGVSYLEAAARMGITKNTVKTHLKLGRSELKNSIKLIFLISFISTIF